MNTVEDIENFDEVSKHPLDIEYEKRRAEEKLFRLSYSALSSYQSCPERYRVSFLDVATDDSGDEIYSDHYYAAVGSAIQAIFEAVINNWYDDDVFCRPMENKPNEPFFDIEHISDSYYSQIDFERTDFYEKLFNAIDVELKAFKPYIVTFKQMRDGKTPGDSIIPDNNLLLRSFRVFPVDVSRYGNIIYIAQNKFLGEVKRLYKEPLKSFMDTILDNPDTWVECEKKVTKIFDTFKVTGSIDFLVMDTKNNTSYVLDGKRLYNPKTNKDSQLLIYCYITNSNKGGFLSYKENKIYWTLPEITDEMVADLEKQLQEMYNDVKDWEQGVEQKEVLNEMCQYCDKNSICKTYNEDITEI